MLRNMHQRLGTAGFIISIIALVAALGGGAYAASGGLSGKQKKEVKKIAQTEAKKFATAGPAGPAGAAGAKGDAGTAGANGTNGSDGADGTGATAVPFTGSKTVGSVTCTEGGAVVQSASGETAVCNGKKGTQGLPGPSGFGEVLPGEKTVTGAFAYTASSESISPIRISISFPLPLAEGLDGDHVHVINPYAEEIHFPAKNPTSSACHGSAAEPTADPGHLCVYTSEPSGLVYGNGPAGGINPIQDPSDEESEPGTASTGAVLLFSQVEAGGQAYGTWALTAPAD